MTDKFSSLLGQNIQLEWFKDAHLTLLKEVANDDRIWEFNKAKDQSMHDFLAHYFKSLQSNHEKGMHQAYVVQKNNQVIGSTRFYDIAVPDKRLAIGFTWLHPSVWGTHVNPECKYLLLNHAFETLEYHRVEFHIDSRNQRSIQAVKKCGATFEGQLRQHKIVEGDYIRDTMLFSIIRSEWPIIKQKLQNQIK